MTSLLLLLYIRFVAVVTLVLATRWHVIDLYPLER